MSDQERIPAWAEALEHRIITEVSKALVGVREEIAEFRAEVSERFTEVNRRFDGIHDDIAVNMARADRAHDRVDSTQAELAGLRNEVSHLHRRIRDVERRLDHGGGPAPG